MHAVDALSSGILPDMREFLAALRLAEQSEIGAFPEEGSTDVIERLIELDAFAYTGLRAGVSGDLGERLRGKAEYLERRAYQLAGTQFLLTSSDQVGSRILIAEFSAVNRHRGSQDTFGFRLSLSLCWCFRPQNISTHKIYQTRVTAGN